jgi:hypothetical protein
MNCELEQVINYSEASSKVIGIAISIILHAIFFLFLRNDSKIKIIEGRGVMGYLLFFSCLIFVANLFLIHYADFDVKDIVICEVVQVLTSLCLIYTLIKIGKPADNEVLVTLLGILILGARWISYEILCNVCKKSYTLNDNIIKIPQNTKLNGQYETVFDIDKETKGVLNILFENNFIKTINLKKYEYWDYVYDCKPFEVTNLKEDSIQIVISN